MPVPPRRSAAVRQLTDLLLGLATLLQDLRGGPAAAAAARVHAAAAERGLEAVLLERDSLTIEVGSVQLVVDGLETDPDFETLRDLAQTLHAAGVQEIRFLPGVSAAEVTNLLAVLAEPAGTPRRWPNTSFIEIHAAPPPEPAAPPGADPWQRLVALLHPEADLEPGPRDPEQLAFALEIGAASPGRDPQVLECLAQLAERAVIEPALAEDLAALLDAVPLDTLRRLLAPAIAHPAQGEFLRSVAVTLPPATLFRVVEATVASRADALSSGGLNVLARLSQRARHSGSGRASKALAAELLRLAPETGLPAGTSRATPEPERVLKLAFESGILEPGTLVATDRMIARREVGTLLGLLDSVPREDPVARVIRGRVFHPQTVRRMLEGGEVDLEALDRLVPQTGIESAPALFDTLAVAGDRRVRLGLLDLLARYGEAIGPLAVARLDGMPWYVQRNLLVLLGRLPGVPDGFSPGPLLLHRDPRVRHEALALAIADPTMRERSVARALDSEHPPTVRLGLESLVAECPPGLVSRLVARITDPGLDPDLRVAAVTAVARVNDPMVLRLLRRLVVARGITGLGRLASKSPLMLAALQGLAAHWYQHPKVVPLLDAGRQSRDAEIRAAARTPARPAPSFTAGADF